MSHYVYKRQAIDGLVPGMILGKMLVTQDGKNFLNEGAVLTLRVIQTLQLWGFRYVDIREEVAGEAPGDFSIEAGALETDLNVETETSVQIVEENNKVPAGFQAYYQAAVQIFKMNLGRARFVKDDFEVADIRQMVSECVLPLIEDPAVMDNLQMVSHTEDYLYHHSVDVGILSGCIGMWMGRPFREIEEIILGAMLHDVGKTLIPLKVLNKPDVLTEEERNLVRFHSIRGYKFLKQNTELPRSLLLCALQHHERMDGSGYPLSVQADKIHPYAKIIAVADVFDAITSDRNYGRKVTPYEAVEILRSEMARKLDVEVCSVFIDKLCQRFVGDVVELSDGRRGEVVFLNQFDSTRPMVRTSEGCFVDLDKSRDLSICKMLHS
ncbi:MAG: HD-GYP domain-containing protein [Negativicutes bacterium]